MGAMTEAAYADHPAYPYDELAMDLVDRLNKSLRRSGLSVGEMAQYLEVNRNTVGTWLSGKITPRPATLRLWAMKTNVPYEWLRGEVTSKCEDNGKSPSKT